MHGSMKSVAQAVRDRFVADLQLKNMRCVLRLARVV
jgi:hypothetical protein